MRLYKIDEKTKETKLLLKDSSLYELILYTYYIQIVVVVQKRKTVKKNKGCCCAGKAKQRWLLCKKAKQRLIKNKHAWQCVGLSMTVNF